MNHMMLTFRIVGNERFSFMLVVWGVTVHKDNEPVDKGVNNKSNDCYCCVVGVIFFVREHRIQEVSRKIRHCNYWHKPK